MNVFISYSVGDGDLVKQIAAAITPFAQARYWENDKVTGEEAWKTIFGWIDEADLVLAVITDKTVARGLSVGQEIGHAKAKGKLILPMVGEGIPATDLGCLGGITYETVSKDDPSSAIQRISVRIAEAKQQKDAKAVILAICGFIALLYAISGNGNAKSSLPMKPVTIW